MNSFTTVLLMLLGVFWASPGITEEARKLTWEDLVPAHLLAADPVTKLPVAQQDLVNWIIYLRENLPSDVSPETQKLHNELNNTIPQLKEQGLDIDAIIAKRNEINNSVVSGLDGLEVSIPGYLIPLELNKTEVTEFLLVPYVGACIHVPPPPPNQIIHVKITGKKGYSVGDVFAPVWVTGVISTQSTIKDLFLTDGSGDINIGYMMQAHQVETYKE